MILQIFNYNITINRRPHIVTTIHTQDIHSTHTLFILHSNSTIQNK